MSPRLRFRIRPLTLAAILVPTAAMGVLAACGNADNSTTDGGADATVDVTKDVTPDVPVIVEAGCDAPDLLGALTLVDASAFGGCLGCLESTDAGCGSSLATCNGQCLCRQGVIDLVGCVTQGGSAQTCFLDALGANNADLTNLLLCAQQKCLNICLGTGDGGVDGGDGGSPDGA